MFSLNNGVGFGFAAVQTPHWDRGQNLKRAKGLRAECNKLQQGSNYRARRLAIMDEMNTLGVGRGGKPTLEKQTGLWRGAELKFKAGGGALALAGAYFQYGGYRDAGDSTEDAAIKTILRTAGSLAVGGVATALGGPVAGFLAATATDAALGWALKTDAGAAVVDFIADVDMPEVDLWPW